MTLPKMAQKNSDPPPKYSGPNMLILTNEVTIGTAIFTVISNFNVVNDLLVLYKGMEIVRHEESLKSRAVRCSFTCPG